MRRCSRGPSRRRQHLLDGVSHEGVGELIRGKPTTDLDEEAGIDELVETGADLVDSHVRGEGQNPELDTLTGDRGQLQKSSRPQREPGHPRRDDVPDAVRRPNAGHVSAYDPALTLLSHDSLLHEVTPQLAEEEGVSSTAVTGNRGEATKIAVELLTQSAGNELFDAGRVEATQPHADDTLAALQVDQAFGERLGELGRDVAKRGNDHQTSRRAGAHQVSEEFERRATRPMDVVEQENHRRRLSRVGQHPIDRRVQQVPLRFRICCRRPRQAGQEAFELRQEYEEIAEIAVLVQWASEARKGTEQMIERVNPWLVRKGELRITRAQQNDRARFVALAGEIGGQPGLAGTCFTADQHHLSGPVPGAIPCIVQHAPFRSSADQRLTHGRCDPRR